MAADVRQEIDMIEAIQAGWLCVWLFIFAAALLME
jgi:hypothetical protein